MNLDFKKYLIYLLPCMLLTACSEDNEPGVDPMPMADGDIYLMVSLDEPEPTSRVSYEYTNGSGLYGNGNIQASWQIGDLIKVYESDDTGAYSDVYADYDAYNTVHPYPAAPERDTYYRFECVGGQGTPYGIFKYVGLATATVITYPSTGIRNVNVDIKYGHAIHNWSQFKGLAIFGNPLRNTMMRTQNDPDDMSHLRFGERMYANVMARNFQLYADKNGPSSAGVDRLVFHNVEGCIYRVIIGGVDTDIYGGSTLSIQMPGVTDLGGLRSEPMTLTLGNSNDFLLGNAPWSKASIPGEAVADFIRMHTGYLIDVDTPQHSTTVRGDIPKGEGTLESPYNPSQAIEIARQTSINFPKYAYVKGYVHYAFMDLSQGKGIATLRISDKDASTANNEKLEAYNIKNLGNVPFTSSTQVKTEDRVIIYGALANYNEHDFAAYIVGWPGQLSANDIATVQLHEYMSGYTYTWQLRADHDIKFDAGSYYTIDLREHPYTKSR